MHIMNFEFLGILATALLAYALFPAYRSVLALKNVQKITMQRLILLVITFFLWIIYGISDSSPAIVLLATFSFAVSLILLIIKLRSPTYHD